MKDGLIKKGTMVEWAVYQKCKELGYDVAVGEDKSIDLMVNGFDVEVKSSYKPTNKVFTRADNHYHHFRITPKQSGKADFFICCDIARSRFFIIPNDRKGVYKMRDLYIRDEPIENSTVSREHSKYLNAWNLLENKNYAKNLTAMCNNC